MSFNAPWNQKDKLANKNGYNNRYANGSLEFQRGDTIFAKILLKHLKWEFCLLQEEKIFSQEIMCLQKPVKSAWNFRVRRQGRVREEPVRAIDRDKKKQSWYPIVKYSLPTLIREILEKTSSHMMVHWWQWVRNLLQPHWCLPHDPFLFPCLLPFLLSCSWQPIICVCVYPFVLFLLVTASSLTTHHGADQRVIFSTVISSQFNSFSSCEWWWQKALS